MRNRILIFLMVLGLVTGVVACQPTPDTDQPEAVGTQNSLMEVVYPTPGIDAPYVTEEAAVRTECFVGGEKKDDPLQPGVADPVPGGSPHLHAWAGSTAFSADMTQPRDGRSTCFGGSANESSYWVPVMFDISTFQNTTPPVAEQVPFLSGPDAVALQTYYKSAYDGVLGSMITEWFPDGLRMVAGAGHHSTTGSPHINWSCIDYSQVDRPYQIPNTATSDPDDMMDYWYRQPSIPPNCPPGKTIQLGVNFPQCGAEDAEGNPLLDSADHRSHMSYAAGWPDNGCPTTHPRIYPKIEQFWRWRVPEAGAPKLVQGVAACTEWRNVKIGDNPTHEGWPVDNTVSGPYDDPTDTNDDPNVENDHCPLFTTSGGTFRLASDAVDTTTPAGYSGHSDWWEGWDEPVESMMLSSCFGTNTRDCRINLVGKYIDPVTGQHEGGWWRMLPPSNAALQPAG